MATIQEIANKILLERAIKELILNGEIPTESNINTKIDSYIGDKSTDQPLFRKEDFEVSYGQEATASYFNSLFDYLSTDVKTLIMYLFATSLDRAKNFDRWRLDIGRLESKIDQLQERIATLLLSVENSSGYIKFVADTFSDASKVDLVNSTIRIDPARQWISIDPSDLTANRLKLQGIPEKDIGFELLTKKNLVSSSAAPQSKATNIFDFTDNFWQQRYYFTKPSQTALELKVDLSEKITISRITIDLHTSNANGMVQITPMLSEDNINWNYLPIDTFTQTVNKVANFIFTHQTAQYIKFIFTKQAHDLTVNNNYVYEFGVDEIALYKENFQPSTSTDKVKQATLISQPLSILDTDGSILEFTKASLQVCQDLKEDTDIRYYLTASNTSTVPISGATWQSIAPLEDTNALAPQIVDFEEGTEQTQSSIGISYDATNTSGQLRDPDPEFTLITAIDSSSITSTTATASDKRYILPDKNIKLLDTCFSQDININKLDLNIWRNTAVAGSTNTIRKYSVPGWGFDGKDKYYSTILINSDEGLTIDVGPYEVIVDDVIHTGKITLTTGEHQVQVYQKYFKYIDTSSITNLSTLKSEDDLYPYNHRYLFEGLSYPAAYPNNEEQIYVGADIIAEYKMRQVAPHSLLKESDPDILKKFALDLDAEDTSRSGTTDTNPTRVILVRVDTNYIDFLNEQFTFVLNLKDSTYKYLRLKAVLETRDFEITPTLDYYRIKLTK